VGAKVTEAKLQIRLYHGSIETYVFFRNDRKTSGIVLLSRIQGFQSNHKWRSAVKDCYLSYTSSKKKTSDEWTLLPFWNITWFYAWDSGLLPHSVTQTTEWIWLLRWKSSQFKHLII